jgi:hypothetical protein
VGEVGLGLAPWSGLFPGLDHPLLLLSSVPQGGSAAPGCAWAGLRPTEPLSLSNVPSGLEGGLIRPACPRGFRALWMRKGSLDPSLGFPATSLEVRQRVAISPLRSLTRSPPPTPLTRSFAEVVAMDRYDGRNKRHHDGYGEADGRWSEGGRRSQASEDDFWQGGYQ